jgi:hypothetical protein
MVFRYTRFQVLLSNKMPFLLLKAALESVPLFAISPTFPKRVLSPPNQKYYPNLNPRQQKYPIKTSENSGHAPRSTLNAINFQLYHALPVMSEHRESNGLS